MATSTNRTALLVVLLLAAGCADKGTPMTPQAMAAAVAECERLGLEPETWRDVNLNIVRISCRPK